MRNIDTYEIDRLLWLSSPVFKRKREKHMMLHSSAVLVGRETAAQHPVDSKNITAELVRFKVNMVYFQHKSNERAYYEPAEKAIYLNAPFIAEMAEYLKSQSVSYFTSEKITEALTLHELFHHIEENLTQPTDILLKCEHKTFVPPVYREIAAFAFVNAHMGGMVSQLIDIYWLKKHHPAKYAEIPMRGMWF